jgi:5-methyltetrahydrofolate--homocysteine methyltransferase
LWDLPFSHLRGATYLESIDTTSPLPHPASVSILTRTMKCISEQLADGRILVSDGAWGTYLQKNGLTPGTCPELWNIERPDVVRSIAESYVEAGAHMVETNSFGGTRFKLEHYGLADRVSEINKTAAALSREAIGDDGHVIASIGPTGKMLLMGDVTEAELEDAFAEQAIALEQGGADACCIETFAAIDEASLAVKAVKANTDLEIICTFTFERTVQGEYRTMMGVSPAEMTEAILAAGAAIVGTNCGNGSERMIEIVREIRAASADAAILVHANAGMPTNVGGVDTFPENPSDMASHVEGLIAAGAGIIGGCCGTTPAHIKAIRNQIDAR